MTFALSWALSVASGSRAAPCIVPVRLTACCGGKFELCILQGASKTFTLRDAAIANYGDAVEITFTTWKGGAETLSYSATGGEVTQPTDHTATFNIPHTDSTELDAGRHYAEVWITFSDGTRIGGRGTLRVEDTRKYD